MRDRWRDWAIAVAAVVGALALLWLIIDGWPS